MTAAAVLLRRLQKKFDRLMVKYEEVKADREVWRKKFRVLRVKNYEMKSLIRVYETEYGNKVKEDWTDND